MKKRMQKKFLTHQRDGLNTILNYIEKRMHSYRNWYKLDLNDYKPKARNAIMKDISLKLGFGHHHRWILSSIVLDELKAEEGK